VPPPPQRVSPTRSRRSDDSAAATAGGETAFDDNLFEIRLLRQKVGALEGEVTFLKQELDAARAVRRRGSSVSPTGRRYPSPTEHQQVVRAAPEPTALSYSMRADQRAKIDGMSIDQRLAALQDLQHHMSLAKAAADSVYVGSLAAPRADLVLNLSPPRVYGHEALGTVVGSRGAPAASTAAAATSTNPYSPTQQRIMDTAVLEAQRALSGDPSGGLAPLPYQNGLARWNAQYGSSSNFYAAALNRGPTVQLPAAAFASPQSRQAPGFISPQKLQQPGHVQWRR
jgi:hypothetical protein